MEQDSKKDLIVYPYLPKGRIIKIVDESNQFMQVALDIRKKSKDKLIPIGIVAVNNNKIVGEEVNKPGYESELLVNWHKKWMCIRRWFKAKTGTKYWLCPGCAGSDNHAESRLIKRMRKEDKLELLKDSDIYMAGHWWCCKPCWDKMIECGVRDVYVLEGAKDKFDKRTW